MKTFKPGDVPHPEFHKILLSGVSPRPIALVSTVDEKGNVNLSPYSFFNAFSSNPPVVAFGPAHRATDSTAKDTYTNLVATGECVINAVTYNMVEQSSLSSCNYPSEVDEFAKSGFTKRASSVVAAPGVAESPFIMECKLLQMIDLGTTASGASIKGSGNLALCSVELVHVTHSVFTGNVIDPRKMDLVGRMGLAWYSRANEPCIFELPQPRWNGIGFDNLPEHVRASTILTGNDLAKLAGVKELPKRDPSFPAPEDCADAEDFHVEYNAGNPFGALHVTLTKPQTSQVLFRENLHKIAQLFLKQGHIEEAWQTLLLPS